MNELQSVSLNELEAVEGGFVWLVAAAVGLAILLYPTPAY